jgi:hypothetical protein
MWSFVKSCCQYQVVRFYNLSKPLLSVCFLVCFLPLHILFRLKLCHYNPFQLEFQLPEWAQSTDSILFLKLWHFQVKVSVARVSTSLTPFLCVWSWHLQVWASASGVSANPILLWFLVWCGDTFQLRVSCRSEHWPNIVAVWLFLLMNMNPSVKWLSFEQLVLLS